MNQAAFSGKAGVYASARPSYPAVAVDYLLDLVPTGAVVADVGAGTGKLTKLIAQRGVLVCGIEPNPDMRAELVKTLEPYPPCAALEGSAEATGLPDHCIDLIVCAQALHWFDGEKFWAECRRIGKPDAVVAAVYNHLPGDRVGPPSDMPAHRAQALQKFFRNANRVEFESPIEYDRAKWREYMLSHSHSPLPSDPGYPAALAQADEIFDAGQVGGLLTRILTTTIYWEKVNQESLPLSSAEPPAATANADPGKAEPTVDEQPEPAVAPKKGRRFRPRHLAFLGGLAIVLAAETVFVAHLEGRESVPDPYVPTDIIPMPLDNEATNEQILAAFNSICETEAVATPEYDDRFTFVYQCVVGDSYLWLTVDRGRGDAIREINLQPCLLEPERINTITGGRWWVDMIKEELPTQIDRAFPAEARRWWCPEEDPTALP